MNFFGPAQIAQNYCEAGKGKVSPTIPKMFLLGIMAGAFIAFGGVGSAAVGVSIPYASLAKFLGACVFPAGLTMVLCAGGELFTGNCLLVIPLYEKQITLLQMLKNWIVVYISNFVGAALVAAGVVFSHQPEMFGNGMAVTILSTAVSKCTIPFGQAFLRGILCNILVCLGVWIAFAAKDIAGKIIGLFFPVMIFVLCGFEHSVANMYYFMAGLFELRIDSFVQAAVDAGVNVSALNVAGIAANMIPVTLGNIVGGSICVGTVYWFCYLKRG